jgi:ABC-type cobalamin/Fe3+-siderophores transport system ATPase subunit
MYVTETRPGGDVESGHAATTIAPVLAAGVGIRYPGVWALRLASFRLDWSDVGTASLGVVTSRSTASAALADALSGHTAPSCGSLRVLGYDMATAAGRAAVRGQAGVVSRPVRPRRSIRIRTLVERAAKRSGQPGSDRHLLAAAILDRLALTPWAPVPLTAAPELIARKARLAAACVHQPKLLLIDGLLDCLPPLDRTVLADSIRDLGHDTAIIAFGRDPQTLSLICDHLVTLAGGIMVGEPVPGDAEPAGLTSGRGAPGRPGSAA